MKTYSNYKLLIGISMPIYGYGLRYKTMSEYIRFHVRKHSCVCVTFTHKSYNAAKN